MKRQPTLREISHKSGYSLSAVSLALRNSPSISKKTRNKIQKVADSLNYKCNDQVAFLSRYLKTRKTITKIPILAYVTNRSFGKSDYPNFESFRGAQVQAAQFGYQLDLIQATSTEDNRFRTLQLKEKYEGIILNPGRATDLSDTNHIHWDRLAVVTIGYTLLNSNVVRIAANFKTGLHETLKRIYSKRVLLPALILSYRQAERNNFQVLSSFIGLQETCFKVPPLFFVAERFSDEDPPYGQLFRQWWISQKEKPDCLIFMDEIHARRFLALMKWRIPKDMSYVILNKMALDGAVSGYKFPHFQIGRVATQSLFTQLQNKSLGFSPNAISICVNGSWSRGETLRK